MATNIIIFGKSLAGYSPIEDGSNKPASLGIRFAAIMSLLLSSTLMASEPDEASIAERGRMGIEAYTRVMDALEVPDAQRLSAGTVTAHSGAETLLEAMQTAREAQREALDGEDRRFGYIDTHDSGRER